MHRMGLCIFLIALAGCAPRELNITMKSDNNSGQTGFATISAVGRGITVVVETSAPADEGLQHAHIHRGNCGEVEEIYADLASLDALKEKPGRFGSTTAAPTRQSDGAAVAFEDFETGEWLINVHDSREFPLYVSCGEFSSK
jgi:hypothetical protein